MKKNLYAAETGAGFSGRSGDSDSKGCEDPAEAESAEKAEVEKAVITHPVVVGAFAGILRESGYENIVLADSCGHGTTQAVIRGTGMDTYLEKYHIPAVDYSEGVKTAYPQESRQRNLSCQKNCWSRTV